MTRPRGSTTDDPAFREPGLLRTLTFQTEGFPVTGTVSGTEESARLGEVLSSYGDPLRALCSLTYRMSRAVPQGVPCLRQSFAVLSPAR
jgi:hypothetical protein